MPSQSRSLNNDLYILKEDVNNKQISNAINRCLCKAEALATIASMIDVETIESEIINNYLWELSDIIREARWLYGHLFD